MRDEYSRTIRPAPPRRSIIFTGTFNTDFISDSNLCNVCSSRVYVVYERLFVERLARLTYLSVSATFTFLLMISWANDTGFSATAIARAWDADNSPFLTSWRTDSGNSIKRIAFRI